jgi:hypothetical protein
MRDVTFGEDNNRTRINPGHFARFRSFAIFRWSLVMSIREVETKWYLTSGLFIAAVILAGWLPIAKDLMFEYGDYAANTLLVLDAKRSILLKGHYSRVGFNHPGPAYLYVMALGEYIFHDLLRLTKTPLGGQHLGAALLNAGWLTLLWLLLAQFSRSKGAAMLGLAAFTAQAVFTDPGFLFGVWIPYLYFPTFAVFTLALARVTSGRLDALVPLTVALGFLLHGHASFIGITGVMLIIGVLAHVLGSYWLSPETWPRLFSRTTLVQHRRGIIAAAAIMVVFLLPPTVQTLLHFPGPLGQYASYGEARHSNPLAASLTYVFACWGGAAMFLPAMLLTLLLPALSGGDQRALSERLGFSAAFIAATLAVLLYTVFAVDFLDQAYIIYFYRAVPGLLAAVAATALHTALAKSKWRRWLTLVGILVVAALLAFAERRPADNIAGIPEAYQALVRFEPGPAVLDLDNTRDWGAVWARTAGILAYGKRVRSSAYCVRANWHILFTEALHCPRDLAPGTPILTVTPSAATSGEAGDPGTADVLRTFELDFTRSAVP